MGAFLQLLWAPRGVTVTPVERTALKAGEPFPLGTAGRSFGSEGELRVAALPKVHARVAPRDGQWRLTHAAPEQRTYLNGRPQAEAALQHLDVLELPGGGPVFRFLASAIGEGKPPRSAHLGDPAGLSVWADALLEANDPLGDRIARALRGEGTTDAEADLRFLGPLARPFAEARLDVEWQHGLIRSAVLRDLAPHGPEPLSTVQQLLALPAARLLEELTLDAGGARSAAQAFVAVLNDPTTAAAPLLKRLDLGDCAFSDAWVDEAEEALRQQLAVRYPALRRAALFGRFRRAELVRESDGAPRTLDDFAELIEAAPAGGAIGVASARLQRRHAHWEVACASGLVLNGRAVTQAALRDGDRLALSTGAAYRLRLER